jgi:hypothetical protein
MYMYMYTYTYTYTYTNMYTKSTWNFAPQMVRCCESVWGQQLRWKCTQHFLVGTWNTRIHMLWTLRTLRWFFHWGKALCADLQKVFDQDCKTKNICVLNVWKFQRKENRILGTLTPGAEALGTPLKLYIIRNWNCVDECAWTKKLDNHSGRCWT